MPLSSAPSHLKLHVPSLSLFQYAPTALCMPRRPAASAAAPVGAVGCWIIVLLTMYLYSGTAGEESEEEEGVVRAIRSLRIAFWRVVVLVLKSSDRRGLGSGKGKRARARDEGNVQ